VRPGAQRASNGWTAAAIGVEVATLLAGAAVGGLVGKRVEGTWEQGGAVGATGGMALAIAPAVLLALAFPATSWHEQYQGTLVVRRVSDGRVVAERRFRGEWNRAFST
jgi:hypothetical protein